ncbi:DUF1993 domain-containing protein [Sphingobium estronivorans]|uniref:DUF1993 domain-containing protein n=1 Tax=Sphingobium estronivorans TaxID=1577690 RepID=UPI0012394AD3|nr:DUF1993 domain-containing protein [Sphingobium estronivorans]
MTLMNCLAPTYVQMLQALSNWIGKAQAQMGAEQAEALLSARLAPDMFPLSTQIRFACVQAMEGMFRIRGEAFPPSIGILLNEGRNGGEHPGSLADAQARIGEAIALVQSLARETGETVSDGQIAHDLANGMIFDLTAQQYARDWTLPQFYFHVMIAYAILRAQGVNLGKADYVAHMFAHLRPGTMPSQ